MKELKDTVDLMLSDDYKDRFKAEYYQLRTRSIKLAVLLTGHARGKLGFELKCPVGKLIWQLNCMCDYLEVLKERAEIEGIEL